MSQNDEQPEEKSEEATNAHEDAESTSQDEQPADDSAPASADFIGQLEEGIDEIKTMAGELGQKLGGAATDVSAEAKETWKKMEPQVKEGLKSAEATLGVATEVAAVQLKGLFGELKTSLKSLKDKL